METYSQPPKSAQHHNNNTAVNNRSPEIFVFGAENGGNIRTANGTDHLQPRIGSPQESEDNVRVTHVLILTRKYLLRDSSRW
jgi:hypothetical protein